MYRDNLFRELVVDNFAGGGGASIGMEFALGCPVDIAINHDADAIAMHKVNHPYTEHYQEDVFAINPEQVTGGRPVGVLWASPDCKHFSRAKGGKPVDKKIRGLSWVILKWAMSERSADIAKRVERARMIQHERYSGEKFTTNSRLPANLIARYCPLGRQEEKLLKQIMERQSLSMRSYTRIIKIARTIADLSQSAKIEAEHIAGALCFRSEI